jgi:hypothetical protein
MSKCPSQHMSRNRCLLRYGRCTRTCDLYTRRSMWFPCISTQLSALRRTEVRTLLKIPGFTPISWQTFSTRCCITSKSLIGAEYTEELWCPHSQKSRGLRSGDRAGQLIGPPRPVYCWPEVCFRCRLVRWCPTMHEPHLLSLMKRHMFQEYR